MSFKGIVLVMLTIFVGAVPALGQSVVIPNVNTDTPGPSNQAFPFNQGDMRYQQVYAGDQFGGLSGILTEFAFRVDEEFGSPFNSGPINTEIRLSHTAVVPTAMSLVFADNIGPDETLVFQGNLMLSSGGDPNVFDIIVDIDDVFGYNGSDNLLVDIKVFGSANTTQFDAAGTGPGQGGTPWTDRVWAIGVNSASGSSNGDDGYVTQFTLIGATPVEIQTWGGVKARFQ